ncbi:MAG: hypothetical protein J1F11_06910 [Oscillospiraceae bacterium]|nr:hypothetical protein [Oscillospiraceae bacterium]
MNKARRIYLYICLTLTIIAGLAIMALNSISATAEDNTFDITTDGDITITQAGNYIITGQTTSNKITVEGTDINITIRGLNIDLSSAGGCPIAINGSRSSCTLTLDGTNILKGGAAGSSNGYGGAPGIKVEGNNSLTITGEGSLDVTGGDGLNENRNDTYGGAGIGGGTNRAGGKITINGGIVTATGGTYSAGIGGGYGKNGGTIIIEGGTVTAQGGSYSAGIGGSRDGSGGTITIKDSANVTATGGTGGAGIGGGYKDTTGGSGGNITIKDNANVTATGGNSGAGIGGGKDGTCGTIIIEGGKVTANGGTDGAGIGSGKNGGRDGARGNITIRGGTVIAKGGSYGAGIGGSYQEYAVRGDGGNIIISGNAVIKEATGGTNGAGIGGGYKGAGGKITISDNAVIENAQGGSGAAGIGGGRNISLTANNSGTIIISGGKVKATGGSYTDGSGAGIGGGNYGKMDSITITGGNITATKGSENHETNKTPAEHIGNGANVANVGADDNAPEDGINDGVTIEGGIVNDTNYGGNEPPVTDPVDPPVTDPTEPENPGETDQPDDDTDSGNITVDSESDANAPAVSIDSDTKSILEAEVYNQLTQAEQDAIDNGSSSLDIILRVEDAGDTVPVSDKQATETIITEANYSLGQYLNIDILKFIDGQAAGRITRLRNPISITIEVPENMRNAGRAFMIVRIHDGEADILWDIDSDPDTITIMSDRFSTYAIAYQDGQQGGGDNTGTDETEPTETLPAETDPAETEPTVTEPPAEETTPADGYYPDFYPSWGGAGIAPGIAPSGASVPETVTVKVKNVLTGESKMVRAVIDGENVTADLGKENNGLYANICTKSGEHITAVLIEKGKARFTLSEDVKFSILIDSEAYEAYKDDVAADAGLYSDKDIVEETVPVIGVIVPIAVSLTVMLKRKRSVK